MTGFLLRRLIGLALTLLAASLVVFLVLNVLPGDPAALMLGTAAREDTLAALRRQMGLDQPPWLRYALWLADMLRGDFGVSYTYGVPVAGLIAERVMVSLPLALLAILLSTALAVPTGVVAAARRGSALEAGLMGVTQLGVALPNFWLGILLILGFAVGLGWFPASGFAGWEQGLWPGLHSLLLPALALALPQAAILARVTRASVLETLGQDYVRTARAKGLTDAAALWRHAVPNALIPVVTIIGLQFSFLLAGTVIIENVFTLPGLGRLVFQAIAQRDLIVVQDLVVLLAGSVIVVNFLVDLAYHALDPRILWGGP
ncbi:putative peptide ABC transporter permease protein y4tP [Rhodovastum atsumiense]|uniref:ABC transporter permease n=1 Tax=Rhodovastum atsumiense TaxID=504468 RepID=A0A5M6J3G6_9PROT|nr:ABC transporter permease [Rhodovastum atsumiense]KAA5614148.1 ABC transporter permease [Rhodovastum atsumiense]CAH2599002.1 putative peptide ABC transporter permease protein y4tP [Rhodovastum atsumiense]